MRQDYAAKTRPQEGWYELTWIENSGGELLEQTTCFSHPEVRMQFIKDMLETGRLYDLVEVKTT